MKESIERNENIITERVADDSDREFVKALHKMAYHDVVMRQFGSWDDNLQELFFNKVWAPEKYKILLCDGVPCGVTSIYNKEDYIYFAELVISPDFQGRGIGSKILKKVTQESDQTGVRIRLDVLKENQAQHLYRRFGFIDTAETPTHFEMEYVPNTEGIS